ncbi:MAG TPA: BON domain-containing protein [Pyrinomonadaceae bacterium]|nr:BON domain-containing protein [Pyrinomonadaceae bacterium]
MSYEEQQARRSRVVVETPVARREVTQTESVRSPDGGMSSAAVGAIVVLAVALVTLLVLFLMSGQQTDTANENLATETQPTTVVQQPAAQPPPVIIQQAPPAPQQAPIIVTPPAPSGGAASGAAPDVSADLAIQAEIDKRIADSPTFSTLGVTVAVLNGKATIMGTVQNNELKMQLERLVRDVRGVKEIDNQILVSG